MSIDPITAQLDASRQFLDAVASLVRTQIIDSFPDVIPGVDLIAREIEDQLTKSRDALALAETAIKTQIEPALKNAVPNAINTLVGVAEAFQGDIEELVSNVATTGDVTSAIIATLRAHAPMLATWLADNVTAEFGSVALGVLKVIENENPEAINPVLDELIKMKGLPPWVENAVKHARERNAPFWAFLLPAILLAAILPALGAMTEPSTTAVRQDSFSLFPTREAEPSAVLTAFLRGGIHDDEFYRRMKNNGFNDDVSRLMLTAGRELIDPETLTRAYVRGEVSKEYWEQSLLARGLSTENAREIWVSSLPLLSEEAIRQSFLRGIIDEKRHDAALAKYGYTEEQAARLRQLYFYIPPVADLIHMGIRNVFTPEIVKRFNLDGDFPPAFEHAARQQGISDDWAHKYWQAHWIMPGREAFFEMFQRTVDEKLDPNADSIELSDGTIVHNIMGRETLNLALRDVDTPPFYRDKLTQIAYHPLTRIDIRRMASVGQLTHAEVERAYLDLGYNQKNARRLADFTAALAKSARKSEASQLIDGLRRQIIRLYTVEKLSADDASRQLEEIGFSKEEIAVWLAEADIVQQSEFAAAVESGIGKLYVAAQIDATEAAKRLTEAGVPDTAQVRLFARWNLEIEYRGGSAHIHAHKELTKGEVLAAMVDGLIDEKTAETMLVNLGYEQVGADAEIGLALYKSARAVKQAQIEAIKSSFVNGTIEALDASNRLDQLYVPTEQRDAYLDTWTLQRETRTERIPLATLRDMAKGGYIDGEELLAHLKRHRFTDADASLIIRFWTAQPPPRRLVGVSSA